MFSLNSIILYIGLAAALTPYSDLHNRYNSQKLRARAGPTDAKNPFDNSWIDAYAALGDSYGVGIGAGHAIKGTNKIELNTACSQYSYGYPNQINTDDNLGANPNRKFQYLGCSGALVSDVLQKQVPKLNSPQLVTISAGGNDADLSTILNYCVYQWAAFKFWSCERILSDAKNKIESADFSKNIDNLLSAIKGKLRDNNSRIYYTGYSKFWDTTDTACDKVSWSIARLSGYQYLTQDRRKAMNDLVDSVNSKINDAVARAGSQAVFVDWDAEVETNKGRYCSPGVDETYNKGNGEGVNRERTTFYEWGTTKDDDAADEKGQDHLRKRYLTKRLDPTTNATFEGQITNWVVKGMQDSPQDYASFMPGDQFSGSWLPDKYGRVFHPTKFGHGIIANKVIKAMAQEQGKIMNQPATQTVVGCAGQPSSTPSILPIPKDQQAVCGGDLNPNFPSAWVLLDGKYTASDILYRMRDQACQNLCQDIKGVPGHLVQAKKQSDNGCEYAVKIAAKKELYLYATSSGQNCYDATEKAINKCLTKTGGANVKNAGWLNGPNFGEFYQVGVRDVNGNGNHHNPFPDTNDHLGYRQIACKTGEPALAPYWRYSVQISEWDDGNYGRSIRDHVKDCSKALTDWKYEDTVFNFADGYAAQKVAGFNMPLTVGSCPERKMEEVFGLSSGSITCSEKGWTEVNMF